MYHDTLLVCSTRVPYGVNSISNAPIPTTRRAVFAGADAAKAFLNKDGGRINQDDKINGGREVQINVGGVSGIKKVQFNGVDYGTIVISSYAITHTS
jgi:hypothetical protein